MSGKNHVPYKVMLVEDDESFRRTFAGFLLARFPSVVIEKAADGAEAIERIQDFLPDLVFMDIKLPGENGFKVTRRIKALFPDIKVVILASDDFPEYREAARACGAYHFLTKGSLTPEDIQNIAAKLCAKRTTSGMQSA
jgi:two-component system response regulator YesN